jgi:hypothetical protein
MALRKSITNDELADALERVGDLLEAQSADRYRVLAYRRGAETIRRHEQPLVEILAEGGIEALEALPTLGHTLAAHVAELAHRGHLTLLERLEGEVSPEALLCTVPGLGPELARRIHHELHVDTLEELEVTAHDGRLERLPGFGPRRVRAIREELASILGRSARHRARRREWLDAREHRSGVRPAHPRPEVATILALDADYRSRAAQGALPQIAPRRFNPEHRAWLPILHAERDGWHFTVLFSNTARAHELGRTNDWVVLYYSRDSEEGQCTVVTERSGPLRGRRVVRGREQECHPRDGEVSTAGAPPTLP